jgi:lysophospholipase L1-like esterase
MTIGPEPITKMLLRGVFLTGESRFNTIGRTSARLYQKVLLLAISAVFSLALLEAVVRRLPDAQRILFVPSRLPGVAYQLAPGTIARYGPYEYRINSWGWRYPELPKEKPEGYFRIFGLGDSVLFGQNTGKNDVAAVLEEKLNAKPLKKGVTRWQVINTGVLGYNTCQEAALLRELVDGFKPDMVFVEYCVNDAEGPHAPFGMDVERGTMPPWWRAYHWVKGRFVSLKYIVQKLSPTITRLRGRKAFAPPIDLNQEIAYTVALHDPKGPFWGKAAACISSFGEYQKRTGTNVVFTIFPLINHLGSPELEKAYAQVERTARDAGLTVINLYPSFKKLAPADVLRMQGDGMHPTEDGHVFAAGVVYDALAKRPELFKSPR